MTPPYSLLEEREAGRDVPHVVVCICTYRRPQLLHISLSSICRQKTDNIFTYSVVVADNDIAESARSVVSAISSHTPISIRYCVERQQNIARARNTAITHAVGDLIAFVDDDEFVSDKWLLDLFRTMQVYRADGVLGPVDPHFDHGAPRWVVEGGFYSRPVYRTGTPLHWSQCRTGNVLFKADLFEKDKFPFNPACLSGEDQEFFRRKSERGCSFIWCHEASAFEMIPSLRWKRSFLVRRALFRGIFAQRNHGLQPLRLMQALISVPIYTAFLPLALALGQTRFMNCVFKLSYHTGRLLGFFGLNPIRQAYVVE
jgi:succinoglycan biosynthesis protein ExoM